MVAIFDLDAHGVAVVGDVPGGFPAAFEVFDGVTTSSWWLDVQSLAVPALVIAIVGYLESISISKAMSMKCAARALRRDWETVGKSGASRRVCLATRDFECRYRTPEVPLLSNQELYGIGFANIAAGCR